MSEKNAQSYRNELEALLRRAEDDGYHFTVELDVETSREDDSYEGVDTDYYFVGPVNSDYAHVDSDLIWEREI